VARRAQERHEAPPPAYDAPRVKVDQLPSGTCAAVESALLSRGDSEVLMPRPGPARSAPLTAKRRSSLAGVERD
jgi:hypothetical protein